MAKARRARPSIGWVCGTGDLELTYEIVQPDGTVGMLPVALRRRMGLVRLGGDDRSERDLRLVQGSALDRRCQAAARARVDGLSCVICRAHAEKLAPSRSGDRKILAIAAHGHGIVIACATKQFTVLNRATYIGAAVVRVLGVFVPIGGGL
jgi:hypothetical protein